jgi:hypothetical protein
MPIDTAITVICWHRTGHGTNVPMAYDPTGGVAWCAALCGALLFSWGFQVISNLKSPSRCRPLEF